MNSRLDREPVNSAQIAAELRERPEALDELTRARMERAMVQAWRTRPAAQVPLPSRGRVERPARLAMWASSLAIAAAAGAVVAYFGTNLGALGGRADVAQFELRIGDAAVQRGTIVEGQVLESGELGDIEVDLGSARVMLGRGARVRFDRLSETELRLGLASGRIDVDFHPARKGEQQLLIESRAARVRVVGTRFSVETDAVGNTEVAVREGVVEVTPLAGGPSQKVVAGGRTYVRADEGDAYERAVRAAIEQQLETLAPGERQGEAEMVFELDDKLPSEEVEGAKLSSEAAAKKLDQARALLRDGRHPAARGKLRALLATSGAPQRVRVEALTLIAESHTAQGDMRRAVEAYEQAALIGVRTPSGDNAQFALARLLERFTHDRDAAADAYARYLDRAPNGGALATQARAALCRLRPEHTRCAE